MTVFACFSRPVVLAAVLVAGWSLTTVPALAGNSPPSTVVAPPVAPSTTVAPETQTGGGAIQTPGCNPVVAEAANRAKEVRVAYAKAMSDEVIPQNVSVLQQTCMNQAAGVSSSTGGFFSGEFTSAVQPIVGSALGSFYDDFSDALSGLFGNQVGAAIGNAVGDAIGGILGGAFGGGATSLQTTYDCDGFQETREAVQNRGVVVGIEAPSLQKMLSGESGGGGEKFKKSLDAAKSKNVMSNAKTAIEALPKAEVKSFKGAKTLCDALAVIGKGGDGCRNAQ